MSNSKNNNNNNNNSTTVKTKEAEELLLIKERLEQGVKALKDRNIDSLATTTIRQGGEEKEPWCFVFGSKQKQGNKFERFIEDRSRIGKKTHCHQLT